MPKWKDISGLSDQEAKKREAAFEAEILATLAKDESQPPVTSPAPTNPLSDGVQISVTVNGHTTLYSNLETVPLPVQKRILNAWLPSPTPATPSLQNASSIRNVPPAAHTPRPRSLRFGMALNLLLPGAGQFYFGQRIMGSMYAIGFIACFTIGLLKFLGAYFDYLRLSTSGDILESGNLEQLTHAFPTGMLVGLTVVSIVIYLASAIHLALSHPRR